LLVTATILKGHTLEKRIIPVKFGSAVSEENIKWDFISKYAQFGQPLEMG
jgi:hypothetical protein